METTADELIPTRATLIQRLKNWQDQSSWQEFFDTYWSLIYGVAIKGGLTRAEAEDVVQETLVSVAKHMPTFQYDPAIGSFKGWLLTVTRWRIMDHLRLRKHESHSTQPEGDEPEIVQEAEVLSPDLEQLWDVEWESNLLNAAVTKARRRLDPHQYQIFDFYVNKDWAPEKVAKAFSIPIAQVYLAKHRVTEAIREEVERLRKEMI
jgi:RNA polymerase sigma factor (sigma-70 family)